VGKPVRRGAGGAVGVLHRKSNEKEVRLKKCDSTLKGRTAVG